MSTYPYSRILLTRSACLATCGPHIQVFDLETGSLLRTTRTQENQERLLKSGPISCICVHSDSNYVVTVGGDKFLRLWRLDDLEILCEIEAPKKPTCVQFLKGGNTVILSDKFGDVYSYSLSESSKGINFSDQSLLMGHTSLLTSFSLSHDEKYIVTADRDEHIRVSWHPEAYVIESFCLGHKKFVSTIHVPLTAPDALISGGGDPTIKIWNWMKGELIRDVPIQDSVMPFIKVMAPARGHGPADMHVSDDDGEIGARQRRREQKAQNKANTVNPKPQDASNEETTPSSGRTNGMELDRGEAPSRPMLIVQKISSHETQSGVIVIFIVVGATALFYFVFDSPLAMHEIRHLDFGKPLLDFATLSEGELIVSLDGQWSDQGTSQGSSPMVEVIKFIDGQFVRPHDTRYMSLLRTMNGDGLIQATPPDLAALELYSAFVTLPKNVDAEYSTMNRDVSELLISDDTAVGPNGRPLSAKELARLKNKKALLESRKPLEVGSPSTEPAEKKFRTEEGPK